MRNLPAVAGIVLAANFATPDIAQGFTIQFDYTYDTGSFFSVGSDARDRLNDAGAFFEGIIGDDFDSIESGGGNSWNARISHPTNGGPTFNIPNLVVPADTIIVYVGARNLGGTTLGSAGPGGFNASGNQAWFDALRERGEGAGTTTGSSATDFAPWGGSLTMDVDSTWDYGLDDSTLGSGENHFYSVLIHEIGHVLGVGTSASWDANVVGGAFAGAASVAEFGSNVPLQPTLGHWVDGTMSTIAGTSTPQEAAMDPSITVGTTKFWTDLDNAGLTDIGWQIIAPVPEPSTGLLALFGFLGIAARRRRS